ncbi:chemotaxis protein [Herbaspirillum hiltneri N3]|uniref:Chemotaxis protein n=1 Tax=Herbaspirillum hiltneri N3 TaxID=1262470 RepID=A0ABM5V4E8_9BURK|nr:methyl-accepting chemotaxis protein [Herbaspirillum hiltneri]AKZ64483.1 chemotaxis protein [Herbaspirillum hiltneri N3]
MTNLKVSTRLTIGFTVVLAALIAVAIFGISGMSSLREKLNEITYVNNAEAKLANQMATSVQTRALVVRNLALFTDQQLINSELARLKPLEKKYADAYQELGKLFTQAPGTTQKERELYAALKSDEAAVTPLLEKAAALGASNDVASITPLLVQEIRPKQTIWLNRLAELVNLEDQLNEEAAGEAEATYQKLRATTLTAATVALLLGILTALLIVRSILKQLGGEPSQAQYVASEISQGNLTVALDLNSASPNILMVSLEKMRSQLNDVVIGIQHSAESIATAAGEIAQGNHDLSRRTEEQAASLEETASSMEEITSTVEQNTNNARQGSTLANSASATALKGGQVVEGVVKTMSDISESSSKVTEIIASVEAIAFQTNILALNAAVEAARAGEEGRGFAVVASEVRTLAQRSALAAKEIKDLIGTSVQHVNTGSQLVSDAGKTMAEVVQSVQSVTDIMSEIAAASSEQHTGIAQINIAITQMDEVTQQNAALVEQATAAAQAMADQAARLLASVAIFKVEASGVSAMAHPAAIKTITLPPTSPVNRIAA